MAPSVGLKSVIVVWLSKFCVYSSWRPVWVWSLWLWCGCLSSVSIPHGALCGSEVCDCGVSKFCVYSLRRPVWCWSLWLWCVWVLCLFLMAPCVGLKSVIVVLLSKFCVFSSRRPVWVWILWLCCGCLSSVSIPHGALCEHEVCDCGVAV